MKRQKQWAPVEKSSTCLTKKWAYLTHAICAGNFGRFLSLPRRDIFACLLLQLLRVNLTSFLLPSPSSPREGRALRRHFTLLPAGPALKSYVPRKFLGPASRIQIGANLVAINYRAEEVFQSRAL